VFALATGAVPLPDRPDALVRLGTIAADVVARAVMRGVYGGQPGRHPRLPGQPGRSHVST
jgi:L-aminopeptidase/D-esterase-like protein